MLEKENSFKIIGKLINTDLKTETSVKTGKNYIHGTATVESAINNKVCVYTINFYTNELKNDGTVSGLYTSYSKMPQLIGKKVEIIGTIRENRRFDEKQGLMVSSQRLEGRFVSGVKTDTVDKAEWVIGGFIVKTLVEKTNKSGEIYRYDLNVAQANYNDTNLSVYTLHVDPNNREIVNAVKSLTVGTTYTFNGFLDFTVTTQTKEEKNDKGFGKPVVHTYTNNIRNFFIEGGNPSEDIYETDIRTDLISAYKAHDVELEAAAKSKNQGNVAVEGNKKAVQYQTSLI